jgi:hypothetical protein
VKGAGRRARRRLDARGRPLRVGDRVRIVGIPDLSGLSPRARAESLRVFRHLVGTYRRIADFEEHGCAELWFRIRQGPDRGLHWVAIEPFLLRRPD